MVRFSLLIFLHFVPHSHIVKMIVRKVFNHWTRHEQTDAIDEQKNKHIDINNHNFKQCLAACSNSTTDDEADNNERVSETDSDSSTTEFSEELLKLSEMVLMNSCVVFGPDDFIPSKTVVLDLGSMSSAKFFNTHSDVLPLVENDYSGFGVSLVDRSDYLEARHDSTYALDAAKVALAVYVLQRGFFWDFLTTMYGELMHFNNNADETTVSEADEHEGDNENHSHEEAGHSENHEHEMDVPDLTLDGMIDKAIALGVDERIRSFVEEPLVEAAVRSMSMMVVEKVEETPAFLMNGEIVEVDTDENSIQDWLLY